MNSLLESSEKVKKAFEAIIDARIEEKTRDCVRTIKAVVSTAYDSDTGLCGVKVPPDNTEMLIPCLSSVISSITVGQAVTVALPFGSRRNAFVWLA